MRRRDREVTDLQEIVHILDTCKVAHVGLVDDGKPYVVPMNFGYVLEDGKPVIYMHGAMEGRKVDVIKKNPDCCVQMECDGQLFEGKGPCAYGYSYYSFMGFGKVRIVDDVDEKIKALTVFMKCVTGKDFEFNEKLVSIVNVFRMDCEEFTAKYRPLPASMGGGAH